MNLRTRFAILTSALVLVVTASMSLGAYTIASNQLERQVDTSLNQRATRILAIVANPRFDWGDAFGRGPVNDAILQTEVDAITQVMLPEGQIIKRREYPTLPMGDAERELRVGDRKVHRSSTVLDGKRFRTLTVRLSDGSWLQLAKDMQVVINARNGMRRWFPVLAAVQVVIAALVGWWFARRISRPIEDLASAAETIADTQDLAHDIPTAGAGEVGALAVSFNTMVAALRRSLSRQRQLVQDASHELRTPLTSLRANTELLERPGLDDARRTEILADMRAEIDELTALSSELSSLATDHRATEEAIPVNLVDVAGEVVARAQRRTGIPVTLHTGGGTIVVARPHQLERAVSNLVDNAIKFSAGSGEVQVWVADQSVEVRDNGPGIPDADKPHVFDRFYRAVQTRSMPGSGLGLAIVAQCAEDNDAEVFVRDNAGGGAVVGIRFR